VEHHTIFTLAADAVLLAHAALAAFIVLGLALILAGRFFSWRWVRNPWFRSAHLLAIGIVVLQSWFGVICPLTTWEMSLRAKAGQATYEVSFIEHWLTELLYYQGPPWVFVLCYTVFGGLVLASWFLVPPRPFSSGGSKSTT